ncbi:hypothetical protein ILYODFUR_016668 [Ilyodon furcidens]|uniref:Uncharacterized protein n=1 Tax=Ilyodon furcidens TaxID=33524 RepID=A0ABV0UGW2_9TELE
MLLTNCEPKDRYETLYETWNPRFKEKNNQRLSDEDTTQRLKNCCAANDNSTGVRSQTIKVAAVAVSK